LSRPPCCDGCLNPGPGGRAGHRSLFLDRVFVPRSVPSVHVYILRSGPLTSRWPWGSRSRASTWQAPRMPPHQWLPSTSFRRDRKCPTR
jgi:hypothetical protein